MSYFLIFLIFSLATSNPIKGNDAFKASCPDGAIQSTLNKTICYKYVNLNSTTYDAENYCEQKYNGYGISITNSLENKFIIDYLKSIADAPASIWLGARIEKFAERYFWAWSDSHEFIYTNFKSGDGSPGTDLGITINSVTGLWSTEDVNQKKFFVCEITINSSNIN